MKKEGKIGLLLIAVIVVVAVIFLRPKGLSAALRDGFAPDQVTQVTAQVTERMEDAPDVTVTVAAQDEAFPQLLALLQEPSYSRTFSQEEDAYLGAVVSMTLTGSQGQSWAYSFQGGKLIQAGPAGETKTYQISGGQATQQEILDFLLEQPTLVS